MLILASASPRRTELLHAAGIDHVVRAASIPEIRYSGESSTDFVRRIAEAKARAVKRAPDDIVLAADTMVCVGDEVLGKPQDFADAARMLRALSGRDHWVHTGICILSRSHRIVDVAATKVSFLEVTEQEIQEYIRSGEPADKAGAYAIQGAASKFISSIHGCYQNVVGLPVSLVYRYLKSM